MHYELPQQPVDIEYWTFLTNTQIAFRGLLNTAETSPQATSHQILQRDLTGDVMLLGIMGYSLHHGGGTASTDTVEMLVQH